MEKVDADILLGALNHRYAVKRFDRNRKLTEAEWTTLKRVLVLTPSSYGLQPWQFVHVKDLGLLKKLTPASWNQAQVEESSHFIVFCRLKKFSEAHIDRFLTKSAEVRGVPKESFDGYRKMMVKDLVVAGRSKIIDHWAAYQVYIALGNLMTSAAALGIDTCPMEGIDPDQYDEILGLGARGLRTVVACAVGFRSPEDKYAAAKKVRFEESEVVVTL